MLQAKFLDRRIGYDGTQLRSHFILDQSGFWGSAVVAFIGPCRVELKDMVDLEDVQREDPIESPLMLHFILEDFSLDLTSGVLLQRLMVVLLSEELGRRGVSSLRRLGDDLYEGERKLNVSIATRSPLSTLVHLGINIQTEGTPVPTIGLEEWGIEPQEFAQSYLERLVREYEGVRKATFKVRAVP